MVISDRPELWQWFDSSSQSRYDAVLTGTAPDAALCRKITFETLYDTAYSLCLLELHCVTDKKPGWLHTEDDRKNCGLVFSLGGRYRYRYNDESCMLEDNRLLYLPAHSRYSHTFLSGKHRDNPWQADMIVLNFHLLDPDGTQLVLSDSPMLLSTAGERYRQDFLALADHFLSPARQPSEILSRVYGLLSAVVRDQVYENKHRKQFHALEPALDLLQNTPPGALRVEDMIRATYLSATRFRILFREYTGMPPHRYLVQHTVRSAVRLLEGTDLTIPEISERLGFDSPSYFGKYIKKHTGVPPKEYQKKRIP
ncbi:MAG: helix-turn-helix transcriptional regulator [Clostridia bacterium]|nr:helix-turn-helix transcriptional regulator [Clostridia bacterium]